MSNSQFEQLSVEEQSSRLQKLGQQALTQWDGAWTIVRLIKYRENAVFEVRSGNGDRAALRIHRNGYHDDIALHSELAWMDALSRSGHSVPQLIRPRDGEAFVKQEAPDVPDARQIDMFAWINGAPVADLEDEDALELIYFGAGELAARLHLHGRDWTPPQGFARHHWDRAGLIGDRALWGSYKALPALGDEAHALLARASQAAGEDLEGLSGSGYGLIHADLVADNLLYGPEGLRLIDFDDSGYGWHMFELATALFFHLDTPQYPVLEQALLAGYRTVLPLSDEEWRRLPLFLFLRSLTYLGWVCTRPETETAREHTAPMIVRSLALADAYLQGRSAG